MSEENNINIDKTTINRILKRIIIEEKQNIKTKKYPDNQMVKKIKKIIEEEVECYDNREN